MSDAPGRFEPPQPARPREPMFNVPVAALLIAASIPLLYLFQRDLPDMGMSMAFVPSDLERGRWSGLLTSMLLHGGWTHAWMNAIGALAFGAPVARLLGHRMGPTIFLLFYVTSGVLAALGYGLIHWGSDAPMVGASGAVFGLIGAATRLMGVPPGGRLLQLTDRRVVTASIAWMGVNVLTGVIGVMPGVDGAGIAWEAHAVGFVFGLLAIGPLARLAGRGAASQRVAD